MSEVDLLPDTMAHSEDGDGVQTFGHRADELLATGVASITKVMTLWVARQWLTTDAALDTPVEIPAGTREGPRLFNGDVLTYRDLMYASSVPSDNSAPEAIGRLVGQMILDDEEGTGDPLLRFRAEMNAEAGRLGYTGANFTGTVGNAVLSARQVADLFRRAMADPAQRATYVATEHTVEIVGGPNPRSIPVEHTINVSPVGLPGYIGGKTGTQNGRGHLVVMWNHPAGGEHVSVIMNTHSVNTGERYTEMRKVMDATRTVGGGGISVEPGFQHVPFVGITVDGLDPAEPSVVTISRSVAGEARQVVQGLREVTVSEAGFFEDWGAPLGRQVTYHLEVVTGAVEPERLSDTIILESDVCWLQDPVNPLTGIPLSMTGHRDGLTILTNAAFKTLTRELPGQSVPIMGGSVPVGLGGTRQAPSRVPLSMVTTAAAQATRLRTLLQTAYPLMLRTTPLIDQLPATSYLHVEGAEEPVTTHLGGVLTRWDLAGDVVRGPAISVLIPRWTYDQVKDLYSTYGETIDGRRYVDWQRDPAGLGGLEGGGLFSATSDA